MFPVGDDRDARRRPYVNWALIAACAMVFAYESLLPGGERQTLIDAWGLVPSRLLADPGAAWPTLVSHAFLHASILHLGGNMLFLWVFGARVEDELGHPGYLAFYLAGGALAGLASVASRAESSTPGIGASGAISAVLAAYLVLHPLADVRVLILVPWTILAILVQQRMPIVDVPAWAVVLIWFGMQLLGGLESLFSPSGVDYAAHVGGFAAGYLAVRGLRLVGFWPDEPDPGEQDRRVARPAAMVRDYVVARRRLRAGEVLGAADVRWVQRGYESLEEDVIPATRMAEVAGRRLRVDRYPLEPIAWSDLEALASEQLPLAPGGRAAPAGE